MRPARLSSASAFRSRGFAAPRPSWTCPSCSTGQTPRRFKSSDSSNEKPYYVTTPIFYVNAAPHVGHMYSMLLADFFKRWEALKGRRAILCTGTDEHGSKVQQAAARQGVAPKELCDATSDKFRELARHIGMDNDHFIRTTDEDHKEAVQYFWTVLRDRGYIYESKHEGWYCVSDECFYAADEVHRTQVPLTGRIIMASVETGNEVEWVEEKNYHFRMTALKERLLRFYAENPDWIVPRARLSEVVAWVTNNLEDLSISRPVQRLDWGVRVPGDPSQTIYVWVDALVNYLTKAGYPRWQPGREREGGWPADLHVIGKDIVRFHGVYWPALLMALDLPLPKQLLTHAHWTLGKKKMSKSVGNVVNPFFAVDRWGLDAMRYFMLNDGGIARDADYENSLVMARYAKDLQSTLGNLVSRVTKAKTWALQPSVAWAMQHGDAVGSNFARSEGFKALVNGMAQNMSNHVDQLNPNQAIGSVFDVLVEANKYISEAAPWKLVKSSDPADKATFHEVLYMTAEAVRVGCILLQPVMPTKTEKVLDMLGVEKDKRHFKDAVFGADATYAIVAPAVTLVPYEARHVERYHEWMSDPDIQEATASEPLSLEEEYENQQSWRTSHDKLTFILCQPVSSDVAIKAGEVDAPERMIGDINFFVYPHDDDEEGEGAYVGEVDVMVAEKASRGKGVGYAAVTSLLAYVHRNQEKILEEYVEGEGKSGKAELKGLMVKIKEGNAASIALFKRVGFAQKGEVNYFGEVTMVLNGLDQFIKSPAGVKATQESREVGYSR
ncbi:putative methionine--tRNA ligase [Colletotrichum spinosum]|uniref:Probable methionine--tRNA ligase, mitochondrial n=1 Tax=Colletotrichum spinosum TaxID=1347390 RepID=A0A4R8QLU1_9PEZI|nr:putative methionine--tRNA ligase [Colletotrichum spinosum]